ncbi:MAG: 4-oxalocrotonate tautomerase [Clostridia bacterium]|jgi:4-oxalocrotonate tautomerase|nr:4-oxalocrotonate tautomerase [Clostridia bacterium]
MTTGGDKMPIVQVEIIKGRTLEQKRQMAKEVTEAISKNLVCPPEAVKIIIREMEKENYAEAGTLFADK